MTKVSITSFVQVILFSSLASPNVAQKPNQGIVSQCSCIVALNDGECPKEPSVPCHTIDTYAQTSPPVCFQSNSTLCFMNGTHVLSAGSLIVENLSNITFVGLGAYIQRSLKEKESEFGFTSNFGRTELITFMEPTVVIQCENSSGFFFSYITSLSLINLTIVNCGANVINTILEIQKAGLIAGVGQVQYVAVIMMNVTNLLMKTVSIQNSTGYGLMGINMLGQSQVTGSSFVGNNQLVKDNLQLYIPAATYCNDGSNYIIRSFYVNTATDGSSVYAGGNAVFVYNQPLLDYSNKPVLNISFCLFAFGVDGSIALKSGIAVNTFNSMGTGVSIQTVQNVYSNVSIIISNTTSYGNQAFYGANFNLAINAASDGIILSGVYSAGGASWIGGGLYVTVSPSLYIHQNPIILLISSNFSTDYNPDSGIFVTVPNQIKSSVSIQIDSCILLSNLILYSTVTGISATINNSQFSTTGCSGGIGAFYTTLKLSDCIFNRTNLYASESYVDVADSTFENSLFSANEIYYTTLSLQGNVNYINNHVTLRGGALALYNSDLMITAPATITFVNNAAEFGGAVYIYTKGDGRDCTIHFSDSNGTLQNPGIRLYVESNFASKAGSVLYGGDIDVCSYDCTLTPNYELCSSYGYTVKVLEKIGNSSNNGNASLSISSDPRSVCCCINGEANCNSSPGPAKNVYPGQTIDISIITVGQLLGASPDLVLSYTCDVDSDGHSLLACSVPDLDDQSQQATEQYCTNYRYTIMASNKVNRTKVFLVPRSAYLESYTYTSCATLLTILPCPFGFMFNQSLLMCACSSVLQELNVKCDINNQSVFRTPDLWIGNTSDGTLAILAHCPVDYCIDTGVSFNILNEQDAQCSFDHSGVLCGGCKPNTSVMFGSTKCGNCTDQYISILIPISLLGVVIVIFLFLFKCTVSVGTLNSLILYANIIRPGIINLLPSNNQNGFQKFLTVFIDWINLDLGIETCFYNGMDVYIKTWLEFLFPLYILAIVGTIIIGSRWSSQLARISKHNAVSVLATLILLSYTTIFHSVITIFSYAQLRGGPGTELSPVWLADGNVLYAQGKHAYLFIAGLIITVAFIIPYTFILLLSPWLQAKSHWKGLRWMNRLKPFMDAYQSPYRDKHRYWPGVHLILRAVLYVVFTTNQVNDIDVNLLACALVIGVYCGVENYLSVYKDSLLNIVEVILMTNIVLLSATLLYVGDIVHIGNILTMISIFSALCVFVVIVVRHLKDFYQSCKNRKRKGSKVPVSYESFDSSHDQERSESTTKVFEYREPLLDDS